MQSITIEVLAKKGRDAINVFQSSRKGIVVLRSSKYRSSKLSGKFTGNVVVGV